MDICRFCNKRYLIYKEKGLCNDEKCHTLKKISDKIKNSSEFQKYTKYVNYISQVEFRKILGKCKFCGYKHYSAKCRIRRLIYQCRYISVYASNAMKITPHTTPQPSVKQRDRDNLRRVNTLYNKTRQFALTYHENVIPGGFSIDKLIIGNAQKHIANNLMAEYNELAGKMFAKSCRIALKLDELLGYRVPITSDLLDLKCSLCDGYHHSHVCSYKYNIGRGRCSNCGKHGHTHIQCLACRKCKKIKSDRYKIIGGLCTRPGCILPVNQTCKICKTKGHATDRCALFDVNYKKTHAKTNTCEN
jgi:hypothetical protein